MNSIRIILLLFISSLCTPVSAQDEGTPVAVDSAEVDLRHIDKAAIDELKADTEMDYGSAPAAVNLWERFKRWIGNILYRLLQTAANANWFNILIVILCIIAIVFVVMRLLKVDALKMIYSGKNTKIAHAVLDEDIHSMDFDKLIQDALQQKAYRLAIRLLFLQALKLLADNHHILWQPGKTNHDYLDELEATNLKTGFNELNFYFEYSWYGNFSINEALFKKVNSIYINWSANL